MDYHTSQTVTNMASISIIVHDLISEDKYLINTVPLFTISATIFSVRSCKLF